MPDDPQHWTERWRRISRLMRDADDIIRERPGPAPPSWAIARGWAEWLGALDDEALIACEVDGLAAHAARLGAPHDLQAIATEARDACALPRLGPPGSGAPQHRVRARKRSQLAAFAAALVPRALAAERLVDVGAGHGHLTRHLAEALQIEAVGLELDPDRVAVARALARGRARFEVVDVFADGAALRAGDLVVGLHACGALTDRLIEASAAVGAAVACVSCCLQKRPEPARAALVPDGPLGATTLPRALLGLGNIGAGAQGVEASQRANIAARARREGLRALLQGRGLRLAPGDEMWGINRRRAQRPFGELVAEALSRRALAPASPTEQARAERIGVERQRRIRRWGVARRLFGRVIEVQISLDRAVFLLRRGYRVELGEVWPAAVSPRNVGLIAHR